LDLIESPGRSFRISIQLQSHGREHSSASLVTIRASTCSIASAYPLDISSAHHCTQIPYLTSEYTPSTLLIGMVLDAYEVV